MMTLDHQFTAEARDLLETIGAGFLALEKAPGDRERVRDIFRAVHTLKGASGIFEALAPLTRVVHAGEDLLDRVREGVVDLTPDLTDEFLDCFDQVSLWLDRFESKGALEEGAENLSLQYADRLRARLPVEADLVDSEAAVGNPRPDWLGEVAAQAIPKTARTAVTYRPDPQVFFQGDDPALTARTAPDLLWLDIVSTVEWPDLEALDPFVSVLEYRLISSASGEELAEHFRYVTSQVSRFDMVSESEAEPLGQARATLPEEARTLLLEVRDSMTAPAKDAVRCGRTASAVRILRGLLAAGVLDGVLSPAAVDQAAAEAGGDGLGRLIDSVLAPSGARVEEGEPSWDLATARPAEGGRKTTAIRVDQDRIDALMDMVGELVVVKNGLPFLAKRAEDEHGNRAMSREIRAQYEALNRVANAIQGSVMRMRMIQVGSVFTRYTRLVRDVARKLDKDIALVLVGEDTEADKTVVEELADPLVHLIRNCCDHGLEGPEERRAAGKPARGTITLSARPEDDHVIIEITDDGRGIDGDGIRRKAVEKGLIDAERAATLSEREVLNLILLPGFSMAATVSDLSGRGVGMDVVKAMVERRGGRLEIQSTKGSGTTVRLAVPLSMALTRVMLFDVAGQQFGVPMASISETRRIAESDIHRVKDQECVVLRDGVVTLKRAARALGLPETVGASSRASDPALLVLNVDGRETALVVDRFHEGMDLVVKPMEGVLSAFPIYSGTALLGDGRVLPIFNVRELIRCL